MIIKALWIQISHLFAKSLTLQFIPKTFFGWWGVFLPIYYPPLPYLCALLEWGWQLVILFALPNFTGGGTSLVALLEVLVSWKGSLQNSLQEAIFWHRHFSPYQIPLRAQVPLSANGSVCTLFTKNCRLINCKHWRCLNSFHVLEPQTLVKF